MKTICILGSMEPLKMLKSKRLVPVVLVWTDWVSLIFTQPKGLCSIQEVIQRADDAMHTPYHTQEAKDENGVVHLYVSSFYTFRLHLHLPL